MSFTVAPVALQNCLIKSKSAAEFSCKGQIMVCFPLNRSTCAATAPCCAPPAIGWAGINWQAFFPNTSFAAKIISFLVLPASVTKVLTCRIGSSAVKQGRIWATGIHKTIICERAAASGRLTTASIAPIFNAWSKLAWLRPTPKTDVTQPAFFKAKPRDAPIKPTPTIVTVPKWAWLIRCRVRLQ